MKRILTFVLALAMALSLAACGGKADDNNGKTDVDMTAQQTMDTLKEKLGDSFDCDVTWACTSRPMITSQSPVAPGMKRFGSGVRTSTRVMAGSWLGCLRCCLGRTYGQAVQGFQRMRPTLVSQAARMIG